MKLTRKVLRKLISEQINLSKQQKQEIDELIKIIDAKKLVQKEEMLCLNL